MSSPISSGSGAAPAVGSAAFSESLAAAGGPAGYGRGRPAPQVYELSPNAAGATRLEIIGDRAILTGPSTRVVFTGVVRPAPGTVNGLITAARGTGVVNGAPARALPDDSGVALRLQSGFVGQSLNANFSNGVALSALARPQGAAPADGFTGDFRLGPNSVGATRLTFPGDGTALLTGPNTRFTFTGVNSAPLAWDGALTASGGSGVLNGVQARALPGPDGSALTMVLGRGAQSVEARFTNGLTLSAPILV